MNNTLYVPCKAIINTAATANISLYNILSESIGFTLAAALLYQSWPIEQSKPPPKLFSENECWLVKCHPMMGQVWVTFLPHANDHFTTNNNLPGVT